MKFQGKADLSKLEAELVAVIGARGTPQRWFLNGSANDVEFVQVDSTLDVSGVAAVIEAHIAPSAVLARLRAKAKSEIDECAGRARAKYAVGELVDQEYKLAEQQAREFKAANVSTWGTSYTGNVPPCVQSYATRCGLTVYQSTDGIIAAADFLYTKLEAIRDVRLQKANLDALQTETQIDAETARIKALLGAL